MLEENKFSSTEKLTEREKAILEGVPLNHYAIFGNLIDHTLLELIHDGKEQLTDDLFFDLLNDDPAYLGTVIFQERIREWQNLCQWPEFYSSEEVTAAKLNLQKIGRVLAKSTLGTGAPKQFNEDIIRFRYDEVVNFLNIFFEDAGEKPSSKLLTNTYPQLKKAFQDEKGRHEHRTVNEIALKLTLFLFSSEQNSSPISLKTLRKITK
jgi:hypothetical protein